MRNFAAMSACKTMQRFRTHRGKHVHRLRIEEQSLKTALAGIFILLEMYHRDIELIRELVSLKGNASHDFERLIGSA